MVKQKDLDVEDIIRRVMSESRENLMKDLGKTAKYSSIVLKDCVFLRKKIAAEYLQISMRTFHDLQKELELKEYMIPPLSYIYFKKSDLDALFKEVV